MHAPDTFPSRGIKVDPPLDFLLISDQIGSSGAHMPAIIDQVKRHFVALLQCISELPESGAHFTGVIKNIGDSLMVRIACDASALPMLLSNIIKAQERLEGETLNGAIKLRILLIPLNRENEDYINGSRIMPEDAEDAADLNSKFAHRVRASNGSLTEWLTGDLFGPKINLAFRAANLSIDESILIIEDSLAKYLNPDAEENLASFPFELPDTTSLRIGERLAFSPIRGLDVLYPFARQNANGWPGHLFLRAVTRDPRGAGARSLNVLALEQQKYKSFTRFMWRADQTEGSFQEDVKEWIDIVQESQRGALYFRNLLLVKHEYEVRRSSDHRRSVHCLSSKLARAAGGKASGIRTAILGVFAAPFETTYERLRSNIFKRKKELGPTTGFEYPITTIVYNSENEPRQHFVDQQSGNVPWMVIIFWRWLPQFRGSDESEGKRFVEQIAQCYSPRPLAIRRFGLVVGGEWDGYAALRLPAEPSAAFAEPKNLKKFAEQLNSIANTECFARIDATAIYFGCDPDVLHTGVSNSAPEFARQAAS